MNAQNDQPKGRSMKELHRIIAAEDARRADLLDAFAKLTEVQQVALVRYAQILAGTPWILAPLSERPQQHEAPPTAV
jgi:hypothetical protein